jgi:serine/threonine protein kinase
MLNKNGESPGALRDMLDNSQSIQGGVLIDAKYKVIRLLGEGGMGTVYLAEQLSTGKTVAVKILKRALNGVSAQRFTREARVLTKLKHPNILCAFAVGAPQGAAPYMVLEYVEGYSLAAMIAEQGGLPWTIVREVFEQILAAVACAHDNDIIHRDLKPSNVMIGESAASKKVRIVDFGIATCLVADSDQKLTQTGTIIGTPAYMAPELCSGQQASRQSDIYALGCILYEMCCGTPPFAADSVFTLMYKHANEDPVFRASGGDIPSAVAMVVANCLRKNPAQRYQTVRALIDDFNSASAGVPVQSVAASAARQVMQRKRRRLLPVLAALCAALLVCWQGYEGQRHSKSSTPPLYVSTLPASSMSNADALHVAEEYGLTKDEQRAASRRFNRMMNARLKDLNSSELSIVKRDMLAAHCLIAISERHGDPKSIEAAQEAAEKVQQVVSRLDAVVPKNQVGLISAPAKHLYLLLAMDLLTERPDQLTDATFAKVYEQFLVYADSMEKQRDELRGRGSFDSQMFGTMEAFKAKIVASHARRFGGKPSD